MPAVSRLQAEVDPPRQDAPGTSKSSLGVEMLPQRKRVKQFRVVCVGWGGICVSAAPTAA